MKKTYLIVSIVLTALVFSMSLTPGESSGSLSLGITDIVYNIINNIFPNNQILLDDLHLVIRKSAHMFEYMVLAISWFLTIRAWRLSLSILLFIGLLVASIDESIQLIAVDRGPSYIDVLVFDFLPFCIMSIILVLINNRKGEGNMASTVLSNLQEKKITPNKAYKQLFKKEQVKRVPFYRRAHFIKLRITIPEEKDVNIFLKVLFFLPLPILFLRIILGFVKLDKYSEDMPLSKREIINLISYRGVKVKVNAKSGEKIYIKTI